MHRALVTALESFAERPLRPRARRFLQGLSRDELQYIADFLGAGILESCTRRCHPRERLVESVVEFQRARCRSTLPPADQAHKMILLVEYLSRAGSQPLPLPVRSAQAT